MTAHRLPSLNALRAFEAVSRHGSMKNAADELCVSNGAVSQLVKKLESQLDCSLLIRQHQSIAFTEEGKILSNALVDTFSTLDTVLTSISQASQVNQLSICCCPAFSSKWLALKLKEFIELYPNINIQLTPCRHTACDKQTTDSLRISLEPVSSTAGTQLSHRAELIYLVASPEFLKRYQITTAADIAATPILRESMSNRYFHQDVWQLWFSQANLDMPAPAYNFDFGEYEEQAIDAAIAGLGSVLVRGTLVEQHLKSGILVSPFGPVLDTQVYYYASKKLDDASLTLSETLFIKWLQQQFSRPSLLPQHFSEAVA